MRTGTAEQLAGTEWIMSDMVVAFQDSETFLVTGGLVDEVAPEGVRGAYNVKDGHIEVIVEAMDTQIVRRGIWDG